MTKPETRTTEILDLLHAVKDPEIPVISVVDLGIIEGIEFRPDGSLKVGMIPTFAGCPALDHMQNEIKTCLSDAGFEMVEVEVLRNQSWSTNRISDKGRKLLKEFGLSPPPEFEGMISLEVLQNAICPKCGSNDTFMMSAFGPTACRAIHHCNNCKETFEQFKPL